MCACVYGSDIYCFLNGSRKTRGRWAICGFHANDSYIIENDPVSSTRRGRRRDVRISFANNTALCSHYYSIYVNRI